MEIAADGLSELDHDSTSTRMGVPVSYDLYNEDTGEYGGYLFNSSNLPTHLKNSI